MPTTLHQYILNQTSSDIAHVRRVTNNENWPQQPSEIENWQEMRPATPEEKKAIASVVDLDLEVAQLALKKVGEPLLTPQEAKSFWQARYAARQHLDSLYKTLRRYEKRQYRAEHFAYPNLYRKALVDDMVEQTISHWQGHTHFTMIQQKQRA